MFFHEDIKADRLPRGTICLTYDDGPGESDGDGPGPHTRELGRFLHEQRIRATFFVVGRHVEAFRESVAALHAWGHLVGNHTYSHPGLVDLAEAGGDVVGEVGRTQALLRPITRAPSTFFRAPYGNWRQLGELEPGVLRDRADSIVAERLNASGRFPGLVGPLNWDIVAEDWECWRQGVPPDEAARLYADEAERVGGGLVLMHDSSEDPAMRPRNQTYAMTRHLVPLLRRRGFRFIALDEVPQVTSATLVSSQVILAADGGPGLILDPARGDAIATSSTALAPGCRFGVAPLGRGYVALRAPNGLFLTAAQHGSFGGTCPVLADGTEAGPDQRFHLEGLGRPGCFAIRTRRGRYLTLVDAERGPRLASTTRRAERSAFTVSPA